MMWFILLFLLRPYIILILSFVNVRDRMALIEMMYTDRLMMSIGALVGIPAVLLIYSWTRREPDGSDFVRKLWSKGQVLLAVSTILNGLLIFIPLLLERANNVSLTDWAQLVICVVILVLLFNHTYIKDCFSEFPDRSN